MTAAQNLSIPSKQDNALEEREFRKIADILHAETGIFLADEKISLVYSRLAKRLRALGLSNFKEYCALIASKDGKQERQEMFAALTTNVTHFFRENHHFEHMRTHVLPSLIEKAKAGGRVRIWSAGCSNGQEPYSIALTILSELPNAADFDIKILATDIDPNMVQDGKNGIYKAQALQNVPPTLKHKYFKTSGQGFNEQCSISPAVKVLVTFRELNLIAKKWPMTGQFDIIFCRNVAIYFQQETQAEIWNKYADALVDSGWLYIGHSERISGTATNKFTPEGITTYRHHATNSYQT